jgi:hypothetical protein
MRLAARKLPQAADDTQSAALLMSRRNGQDQQIVLFCVAAARVDLNAVYDESRLHRFIDEALDGANVTDWYASAARGIDVAVAAPPGRGCRSAAA